MPGDCLFRKNEHEPQREDLSLKSAANNRNRQKLNLRRALRGRRSPGESNRGSALKPDGPPHSAYTRSTPPELVLRAHRVRDRHPETPAPSSRSGPRPHPSDWWRPAFRRARPAKVRVLTTQCPARSGFRPKAGMNRLGYVSVPRDPEWKLPEPLLPGPFAAVRPRVLLLRQQVNAMLYVLKSGCAWRLSPLNFLRWRAVAQVAGLRGAACASSGFHATPRRRSGQRARRRPAPPAYGSSAGRLCRRGDHNPVAAGSFSGIQRLVGTVNQVRAVDRLSMSASRIGSDPYAGCDRDC